MLQAKRWYSRRRSNKYTAMINIRNHQAKEPSNGPQGAYLECWTSCTKIGIEYRMWAGSQISVVKRTSKFWEATRGDDRTSEHPRPASTQILIDYARHEKWSSFRDDGVNTLTLRRRRRRSSACRSLKLRVRWVLWRRMLAYISRARRWRCL